MGLFSSKTVTEHHVGTSISRVIEDRNILDSVKGVIASSVISNEDMIDNLLENSISSIANRSRQMYAYGRERYLYGLPSGEVFFNDGGKPQVQAILDALEGQPVVIQYNFHSALNAIHYGWQKLVELHGYNPNTNRLGNLSTVYGRDVYLEDMVLELPWGTPLSRYEEDALEIWGSPPSSAPNPIKLAGNFYKPSRPVTVPGVTAPQLRVYFWRQNQTTYRDSGTEDSFTIPVPQLGNNKEYFQVLYEVGGQKKYWTYEEDTGVYPVLDTLFDTGKGLNTVFGEFYPNVYFRLNKQNFSADKTSARYRTSKKLCSYTGMNYDDMSTAIHANPDIDDIQSAFMTFAVPADSTDQDDLAYLFEFFNRSVDASNQANVFQGGGLTGYLNRYAFSRSRAHRTSQAITIRDGAFTMDLLNKGVFRTRKRGQIAPVGEYRLLKGTLTSNIEIVDTDEFGTTQPTSRPFTTPYRAYQKQTGPGYYDEVQVLDLAMRYTVIDGRRTVMGDDGNEICLVPLDKTLVDTLKFRNRERLLMRSMHFVFNTYIVVTYKVRWYQTGFFAGLLQIAGIVLTVISMGTDGGFFAAMGAALAAGGVMAALYLLAMKVIIPYVLTTVAFKVFVKAVGEEFAFLVAMAAAAYGIASWGKQTVVATAKDFLQVANGLAQEAGKAIQGRIGDLRSDWDSFMVSMETDRNLIEDAIDRLDTRSILSPLTIFGESPDHFYKRTIHSGNIGTLILSDVHHFVDRSLQLPTFATSVEGYRYA